MKKKIIIPLLVAMILIPLAYSFLTDQDANKNILTTGYNNTEIVEDFPDHQLNSGDTIKKVVQVKNNNSVDCYVRVFLALDEKEKMNQLNFDFNEHWIKQGDYYYYDSIVKVGESTEPLFTYIEADESFNQEKLDIIVYEESVQSEHYNNAIDAFNGIH